jgi:hypothetical protein
MSLKASDHFLHHGDDVLAVAVADALMRFGCWYAAGGRYLAKMIAISGSIERWVNVWHLKGSRTDTKVYVPALIGSRAGPP